MTETNDPGWEDFTRKLSRRLFGDVPRYRMFRTCADGYVVGWTIETTTMTEGRYASLVWKPVGKGARTGDAREWHLVGSLTGIHRTRRAAKARATKLWLAHEASGKSRNGTK